MFSTRPVRPGVVSAYWSPGLLSGHAIPAVSWTRSVVVGGVTLCSRSKLSRTRSGSWEPDGSFVRQEDRCTFGLNAPVFMSYSKFSFADLCPSLDVFCRYFRVKEREGDNQVLANHVVEPLAAPLVSEGSSFSPALARLLVFSCVAQDCLMALSHNVCWYVDMVAALSFHKSTRLAGGQLCRAKLPYCCSTASINRFHDVWAYSPSLCFSSFLAPADCSALGEHISFDLPQSDTRWCPQGVCIPHLSFCSGRSVGDGIGTCIKDSCGSDRALHTSIGWSCESLANGLTSACVPSAVVFDNPDDLFESSLLFASLGGLSNCALFWCSLQVMRSLREVERGKGNAGLSNLLGVSLPHVDPVLGDGIGSRVNLIGTLGHREQVLERVYLDQLSNVVLSVNRDLTNQICVNHLRTIHSLDHDHLGQGDVSGCAPASAFGAGQEAPAKIARKTTATRCAQLVVATYNGNSWKTLRHFLRETRATLVLGQEHKLDLSALAEARIWAKTNGWQAFLTDCHTSEAGGRSAGVFVFAKAHLQAWVPEQGGNKFWRHRGLAVIVKGGAGPCSVLLLLFLL